MTTPEREKLIEGRRTYLLYKPAEEPGARFVAIVPGVGPLKYHALVTDQKFVSRYCGANDIIAVSMPSQYYETVVEPSVIKLDKDYRLCALPMAGSIDGFAAALARWPHCQLPKNIQGLRCRTLARSKPKSAICPLCRLHSLTWVPTGKQVHRQCAATREKLKLLK